MISYIVPTRDRPDELARTLSALGRLGAHGAPFGARADAEVMVVDNDSARTPTVPERLSNGVPVRLIALGENMGAASRNIAAERSDPASEWLVMLDDDSAPLDDAHVRVLESQGEDVHAVSADIHLTARGARESGGLPEVFIGCGVAIRREIYLALGGYDASFGYYAEEYDLAARILLLGGRVSFEPAFRVGHRKVEAGRDMNEILRRLVRNNGWVIRRYAPQRELERRLEENARRYRSIAVKESAVEGYERGLAELADSMERQMRTALTGEMWDRFTGLDAARRALREAMDARPFESARLVSPGKNAWCVERALEELGVGVDPDAPVDVVATMSPGPMIDAVELGRGQGRRVVAPWTRAEAAVRSRPGRTAIA